MIEKTAAAVLAEVDQGATLPSRARSSAGFSWGWLPFFLSALPSLFLLLFVPPAFNYMDSATLLSSDMSFLVPHWPPVYPLFVAFWTFCLGRSDPAIYAIVWTQQILACLASIFVMTAFQGTWRRSVLAVCLIAANYFALLSHGIFTEAISNTFLFFYLGVAARLALRDPNELEERLARLEVFPRASSSQNRPIGMNLSRNAGLLILAFFSLVLMTLTRHNMFIFAALIPSIYLIGALFRLPGQKLQPLFISVLVSLLAFACVHFSNELICKILGQDSAPRFGRPAVYRLHELPWASIPPAEREHLLTKILQRCPDEFSRKAVAVMIADDDPWIGSYKKLHALEAAYGWKKTADQAMNDGVKAFFLTPNRYLARAVFHDFMKYMGAGNCALSSFVWTNSQSLEAYRSAKGISPQLLSFEMLRKIDVHKYDLLNRVMNPRVFDALCQYLPMGFVAIGLCLYASLKRPSCKQSLVFVLALALTGVTFALISAAITVVVPRYLCPVNAAAWLMLAVSLLSAVTAIAKGN